MRASTYIVNVPLPDTGMALLFHGYSGAVDLVSSRVADLLKEETSGNASIRKDLAPDTVAHLASRGYLTEKDPEAEKTYVVELGRRVHAVMKKHSAPGFLLVPTYSCNLRCSYCYEKGLRRNGTSWLEKRMSGEMIEAAFEAMERLDGPKRRQRCLTFYGGEPLQRSNGKVIRLLHERACAKGFRRFSAITNAVDLDAYADLLGGDQGISFLQVTVDGPPSVHDGRRFLPDGEGTFDRIVRNIGRALAQGVRISVRVNVDRRNANRVEWLKAFFEEKGWTRSSLFRAYCSPVHGSPCDNSGRDRFSSHLDMGRAVRSERVSSETPGPASPFQTDPQTWAVQKRILAHLAQEGDLPFWRTAFCGSNMAMYLFDPFGDVYPCWEVIGHPEHRIGRYGPGFFSLDPEAVRQWHLRSVVEIPACRACPYLFFCGGGCEAFAYRATGRLNRPYCFEFPTHFQKAARLAYAEWTARKRVGAPDTGSRERGILSA